jgi:hypothetical protein
MRKVKIFPENKTLYFDVHLFDTQKEMYEYANKYKHLIGRKLTRAGSVVFTFTAYKNNKKMPICGKILFSKKYFTEIVIAHEVLHALTIYAMIKSLKFYEINEKTYDMDDNERLCNIHSNMMKQILERYEINK